MGLWVGCRALFFNTKNPFFTNLPRIESLCWSLWLNVGEHGRFRESRETRWLPSEARSFIFSSTLVSILAECRAKSACSTCPRGGMSRGAGNTLPGIVFSSAFSSLKLVCCRLKAYACWSERFMYHEISKSRVQAYQSIMSRLHTIDVLLSERTRVVTDDVRTTAQTQQSHQNPNDLPRSELVRSPMSPEDVPSP